MVSTSYDEHSIQVLKGLEPVRQRPGMYTRTTNPLHIIQEVIDNAADEALANHASSITVRLHEDNSISIEDDGRGIPVGLHPEEQIPVIELVFTRLHAGGKFDKQHGQAYAFSGGLHGVGVSVTNALSTRMETTVWRNGQEHHIVFAGGAVQEPLHVTGRRVAKRKQGTLVRVWPDPQFFDSPTLPKNELKHVLRSKAVLMQGIVVELYDERSDEHDRWQYAHGMPDYLTERLEDAELIMPLFEGSYEAANDDPNNAPGEGVDWVVAWSAEGQIVRESFVNLIPTSAGGTHEAGLRDGLYQAVKSFIELHSLMPKGVRLLAEDVFARASFILSAKMLDPQFQGQIKDRLTSRDAVRMVSHVVRHALELRLNANVEEAKKLAELVIEHAHARVRSSQRVTRRRRSGVAVLPGKLTDCETDEVARRELFLVEGDSAGGSAKMGRDKTFQAILPLRGKVLNSWEVHADRLFANQEIHDISVAIGVEPHGPTAQPDLSGLRYGRICILSDADVDGAHIQVLLLTLFFRHFPALIKAGHIYIARPPLFRIDVPAQAKRPARKLYCLDESELEATLEKLRKEGIKEERWSVSRFKGLGEMSAEQLWETTMNPDTRRLQRVAFGALGVEGTQEMFTMLMGRGEAAQRRSWLEEKGNLAEVDI
ncbi:MAG TPA: DNA topoisomerase IV subunit B [Paenalcaligenes sp.]|nr:DNA topoisomerase IV subunit B [Paenalcaligenes sp.]